MISLRLLSLLLDENINYLSDELDGNLVPYEIPIDGWVTVNVFELADKAKAWINTQGWTPSSTVYRNGKARCVLTEYTTYDDPTKKEFTGDSEPEAVFKACEYLLTQKEQK